MLEQGPTGLSERTNLKEKEKPAPILSEPTTPRERSQKEKDNSRKKPFPKGVPKERRSKTPKGMTRSKKRP